MYSPLRCSGMSQAGHCFPRRETNLLPQHGHWYKDGALGAMKPLMCWRIYPCGYQHITPSLMALRETPCDGFGLSLEF